MADIKEGANAQAPIKKGRGISNKTRTTTQLKFHEKDSAQNGLFIGHLKEVIVDERTIGDDTKGMTSFAGLTISRLVFHFTSNHTNEIEQRHVYETLLPVESNVATIPNGSDEWRVNNVFAWIKHILDIYYLKGRELTPAEEVALTLPFYDYDEQGEYVPVSPEVVVAGYKTLFENAAAMLNGTYSDKEHEATGKPCYKDANGKFISVWMKLLRAKKQRNEWKNVGPNGDLAFDPFIGEGVIEIQKTNMPPAILKLDTSKESITPKVIEAKVPLVGSPAAPVPAPGGIVAPNMGMPNDMNGAYGGVGGEMPF